MSFQGSLLKGAFEFGAYALNMWKESNQKHNPQLIKIVKAKLQFCTYPSNNGQEVLKEAVEFLSKHPSFIVGVHSFEQGNKMRVVLELSGEISVSSGNKEYPILVKIILPPQFPSAPPSIRIMNPNSSKFQASKQYQINAPQYQKDVYTIDNMLMSIKKWNKAPQPLEGVITDAKGMLSSNFPFFRKQGGQSNQQWGGSNKEGFTRQAGDSQGRGTGADPNLQKHLFGQPSQWKPMPPGNLAPIIQKEWFQTTKLSPQQQQAKMEIEDFTVRAVSFKQEAENLLSIVASEHRNLESLQKVEIINLTVTQEINKLGSTIHQLESFVRENQHIGQSIEVKSMVIPSTGLSKQLLELVSENKASYDDYIFLEGKFLNNEIGLEVLMKNARKIEEDKFMTKYMIKKVMEAMRSGR